MKRMTTTNKTTMLATAATAAVTLLALGGGCNNKNEAAQNAIFKPQGDERVSAFADVQAANGARSDGMLYAHHFEGGQLNSLGRAKVLLMLDDTTTTTGAESQTRVVHLVDAGEGDLLAQRKQSVELYLKTAEGPNELAFHPAAPNLVRFDKTESGKLEPAAGGAAQQSGMTPAPAPMSSPTVVK